MSIEVNEMSGAASGMGFQAPIGIKKRRKKVDEMLALNKESVSLLETIAFLSSLDESMTKAVESKLDEGDYASLVEMIRSTASEGMLRTLVREMLKQEIVRKQPSGNYGLYKPNPNKKGPAKKVQEFPSQIAARAAELQRFPPREPEKLMRLRKDVEKLRKHPELAAQKKMKKAGRKNGHKKQREGVTRLQISLMESLFKEEKRESEWEEYVSKLSSSILTADKKLSKFQDAIEKASNDVLASAMKNFKKRARKLNFDIETSEVKREDGTGKSYVEFSIGDREGAARVAPMYIFIDAGRPDLKMSSNAKAALMKLDPERSKKLRGELMEFKDTVLGSMDAISAAVSRRDAYLSDIEKKLDKQLSTMGPIEIQLLKRLLVKKYRKLGQ